MDTPELSTAQLEAGRDFVSRLVGFGMDIPLAMWAFDQNVNEFTLLLATDFVDVKGPLEISKLLFRAYKASLLPKEIDPFSVALHSVNQRIVKDMATWGRPLYVHKVDQKTGVKEKVGMLVDGGGVNGVEYRRAWLLRDVAAKKRKPHEVSRRWDRFVRNIDKAAA